MKVAAKVSAIISLPRLCFTDNIFCATSVFGQLGIRLSRYTGAFWEQGLSHLLLSAQDKDDFVITLDYDTVFTMEHVLSLLRLIYDHEADAVFGMAIGREGRKLLFEPHPEAFNPDGSIDLNPEVIRAKSGHFGLTVLRCSALKKIPHPWLMSFPNEDGLWKDGPQRADADIGFWIAANHYGWKVLQANHVRIGHLQRMVTWPTRDGGLTHQFVEDWDKLGAPPETLGFLNHGRGGGGLPIPAPEGNRHADHDDAHAREPAMRESVPPPRFNSEGNLAQGVCV